MGILTHAIQLLLRWTKLPANNTSPAIIEEKNVEIKSLRNELVKERKQALDETHKSNQKIQELSVEKAKVTRVKTFATPSGSSNQLHASAKYEQLIDTLEERDHTLSS